MLVIINVSKVLRFGDAKIAIFFVGVENIRPLRGACLCLFLQ